MEQMQKLFYTTKYINKTHKLIFQTQNTDFYFTYINEIIMEKCTIILSFLYVPTKNKTQIGKQYSKFTTSYMDQSGNYLFKVLVVGCCGAGKTCSIRKSVFNQFTTEYKTTIGVDFAAKTIKCTHKGKEINVCIQFWDIAGQEYYSQLSRAYYKGAFGCFVVCDLQSETLINDIKVWCDEVKSKVFFPNIAEQIVVPTCLLCNKVDLPRAKEVWEMPETQQHLQKFQFSQIIATSAVTGQGLDEALSSMAKRILDNLDKQQLQQPQSLQGILPTEEPPEPKKCCQ